MLFNVTLIHVVWKQFDLSVDEQEIKPGRQIELSMSGRPGAYVGLAAYDKALLLFNKNHDLFWEDFLKVFDGFHSYDTNEFDLFHVSIKSPTYISSEDLKGHNGLFVFKDHGTVCQDTGRLLCSKLQS